MFYTKLLWYKLKKEEKKKRKLIDLQLRTYESLDFIRNNLPATKSQKSKLFT